MILFVFSALLISSYDFKIFDEEVSSIGISEEICTQDSITSNFHPDICVIKGKILPDEGFARSMLALNGIKPEHAVEVTSTLKDHIDFRFLSAGEYFEIELDKEKDIISGFSYMPDPVTTHKLSRNEDGYLEYELIELPTEIRYRHVSGKIVTTLNQALNDAGVTPSVAAVAYGILECIVNFRSDARKGDLFTVFLEERYFNDVKLKGGKVLFASYNGKKTGYKAAYAYSDTESNS
ncbi:MAG TPA: hypothetical protein PKW56_06140, partial [Clostridiales bacterium]|nr:hypothetical protein [Clostridiales bacterium]